MTSAALPSPAAKLPSPADITRCKDTPPNRFPLLHRVGECLYRADTGIYYAVLKVKGKQHRTSLHTNDRSIARRKLVDLRRQARRCFRSKLSCGGNARSSSSSRTHLRRCSNTLSSWPLARHRLMAERSLRFWSPPVMPRLRCTPMLNGFVAVSRPSRRMRWNRRCDPWGEATSTGLLQNCKGSGKHL